MSLTAINLALQEAPLWPPLWSWKHYWWSQKVWGNVLLRLLGLQSRCWMSSANKGWQLTNVLSAPLTMAGNKRIRYPQVSAARAVTEGGCGCGVPRRVLALWYTRSQLAQTSTVCSVFLIYSIMFTLRKPLRANGSVATLNIYRNHKTICLHVQIFRNFMTKVFKSTK